MNYDMFDTRKVFGENDISITSIIKDDTHGG